MKLRDFEMRVIELAADGERITIPNVVARLKIKPDQVEKWLDELAREQKLDVDIDEEEAVLVYRVRGLSVKAKAAERARSPEARSAGAAETGRKAIAKLEEVERKLATVGAAAGIADGWEPPARGGPKKSVLAGTLLGAVLPGLGLLYAAPIPVAIAATLAVAVVVAAIGIVGWIPFIGGLVSKLVWVTLALSSGLLGALYVRAFNLRGERAPLGLSEGRGRRRLKG
jgi:VIT1/CCC1 family predicted Fe2+/Mn2+ transporter